MSLINMHYHPVVLLISTTLLLCSQLLFTGCSITTFSIQEPEAENSRNECVVLLHGLGRTRLSMKDMQQKLTIEGYQVTAGALNTGDTDYQLAKSLGLDIVEEAPFSHISDLAYEQNVQRAQEADVVILVPTRCPVKFTPAS